MLNRTADIALKDLSPGLKVRTLIAIAATMDILLTMPDTESLALDDKGPRVKRTRSYRAALARAGKLLKNPSRLNLLVRDAIQKADRLDSGPLVKFRDALYTTFRLVKAFSNGQYRQVSWYNLMLIVAALVYFVAPIDMIPDFILGAGLFDDAMLLTWTLKQVAAEIERFTDWETRGDTQQSRASVAGEPDLSLQAAKPSDS